MKPIQVGLLGIGTVGSGTFNVLKRNQEEITRRAGRSIQITMVADLDVERARAAVGEGVQVVADAGGSPTQMADDISLRRMEKGGVTLTTTNQLIAELAGSWATPEGGELVQLIIEALQG